jgi:hypothetical protein
MLAPRTLAPRTLIAIDAETGRISHGCHAPPIVCLSYAQEGAQGLLPAIEVGQYVGAALERGHSLVLHNGAYDLHCIVAEYPELLEPVFVALEQGRVHDTRWREVLIDIRKGSYRSEEYEDEFGHTHTRSVGYSLAEIAQRRLGTTLAKGDDTWRMRYLELLGVPLAEWPPEARGYAVTDAVTTLAAFASQEREAGEYLARVEADQVRAAFALRATGARGLSVDIDAVDDLESELRAKRADRYKALADSGIFRPNGTKDMARIRGLVEAAYGAEAPKTPSGATKTSMDVLKDSGDSVLEALAGVAKIDKLLTAFVPGLRVGANTPLQVEYTACMETGRTSCQGVRAGKRRGVQTQNLPRSV